MKKTIKAIGIIATMGIMIASAYLLGTTQAESHTIQEMEQTASIYDRYVVLDAAVFHDNYVDMREVVSFEAWMTDCNCILKMDQGIGLK